MPVSSLGYIGFDVSDLSSWKSFGIDFLGLAMVSEEAETIKFRNDERAWRIAVHKGDQNDIAYVGFEVANADALATIRGELENADVAIEDVSQGMRELRGVKDLIVCRDPEGLQIEIFYGAIERFEDPFRSSCVTSGFVTGDQGLGHIVFQAKDQARMHDFYSRILGFKLSDTIDLHISPDFTVNLEFFHCNRRHHTLALAPAIDPAGKKLHHFMLEVASFDDVGLALERLQPCGIKLSSTLGRHTNDHMISFYAVTPSGFSVEFGTGARMIDDENWSVVTHEKTSTWGHKPVP